MKLYLLASQFTLYFREYLDVIEPWGRTKMTKIYLSVCINNKNIFESVMAMNMRRGNAQRVYDYCYLGCCW